MLLRIAKRRTSIEQGREQFIRLEFYRAGQPDLRVSVYEVTESDIVRVRTEHYAGEGLDPRGGPCWDVGQLVATHPIVVPGSNPHFAFAREVHRELPFEGEVDLERFANELFTRSQQLTYEVAKGDMKNYAVGRIRDRDDEWLHYIEQAAKGVWGKWATEAMAGSEKMPIMVTADPPPDLAPMKVSFYVYFRNALRNLCARIKRWGLWRR